MTITISGSGTIGGLVAGGLPDATIVQADLATPVVGTGPAFSAYAGSATALSNAAWTKVLFDTENYDTNNNFASSTFTPTVAGYYQINTHVTVQGATSAEVGVAIYKNGAQYAVGVDISGTTVYTICASASLYMNGTTDTVDVRFYIGTTGKQTQSGVSNTSIDGCLVRAA